jgi:hypothetical protein
MALLIATYKIEFLFPSRHLSASNKVPTTILYLLFLSGGLSILAMTLVALVINLIFGLASLLVSYICAIFTLHFSKISVLDSLNVSDLRWNLMTLNLLGFTMSVTTLFECCVNAAIGV